VIGFFVGAAKGYFERNQPIIQDIISSARLGGGNSGSSGQEQE